MPRAHIHMSTHARNAPTRTPISIAATRWPGRVDRGDNQGCSGHHDCNAIEHGPSGQSRTLSMPRRPKTPCRPSLAGPSAPNSIGSRARASARARERGRACVRVRARKHAGACVRACATQAPAHARAVARAFAHARARSGVEWRAGAHAVGRHSKAESEANACVAHESHLQPTSVRPIPLTADRAYGRSDITRSGIDRQWDRL